MSRSTCKCLTAVLKITGFLILQVVALVGKSGCGKSTCLRLLSRMYEITQGRILLDGRSIDAYDTGFFHRQVVHVSSEIELLSRTIKENVQYGIMGANAIG